MTQALLDIGVTVRRSLSCIFSWSDWKDIQPNDLIIPVIIYNILLTSLNLRDHSQIITAGWSGGYSKSGTPPPPPKKKK